VTQQAVEQALGKLLTDEMFRARFFAAPAEACREVGLVLSSVELDALTQLTPSDLDRLGDRLDARISRPCLDPAWPVNPDDSRRQP
jgi:hypothetical protein